LRTRDYNRRISDDVFDYYRCEFCDLLFLAPLPGDLGRFYPDDYYAIPRSIRRLDQIAARQRYQIELVQEFVAGGRLLEIGPGFGIFAHLARKSGFAVETIEMDERCCHFLREVVGVGAIESDDPAEVLCHVEPQRVIALWHVIEHLPDPWLCLRRAAERLEPGGILVIAAPNPDAWQFRIFGARWPHLDAPRHVQLIPSELLARELSDAGLEPVMLTSNDPGGRGWNAFGWQRGLMNLTTKRPLRLAAWGIGWLVSRVTNVVESRGARGSTYTAVFRKPGIEDQDREVLGLAAHA
jgi:hypothetical protein